MYPFEAVRVLANDVVVLIRNSGHDTTYSAWEKDGDYSAPEKEGKLNYSHGTISSMPGLAGVYGQIGTRRLPEEVEKGLPTYLGRLNAVLQHRAPEFAEALQYILEACPEMKNMEGVQSMGTITVKNTTTDARGFSTFSTFEDTYGAKITVKESSADPLDKLWIFVEGGAIQACMPKPTQLNSPDFVEFRGEKLPDPRRLYIDSLTFAPVAFRHHPGHGTSYVPMPQNASAHLDVEQAKKLVAALTQWIAKQES